ncbi:MAG TPA: hypothetical protein VNV86_20510 [Candidatus Acidoferrum sp.]|jgi:hypothetical protein|nr:hypothetical protein [Candidatus Acidoferrum sp.]
MITEIQPMPLSEIDSASFAAIVDSAAQYFLHMSGEEFVRRWDAGEFAQPDEIPGVLEVLSLLPTRQR